MAIGSPSSAVDPQFREFERVGVGLPLRVECAAAPAKDWDTLFLLIFENHDGRSGDPLARFALFGFHVDPVAPIGFSSHC